MQELGSPWAAAATSLVTFALGALLPLVPWFLANGTYAIAFPIGRLFGVVVS